MFDTDVLEEEEEIEQNFFTRYRKEIRYFPLVLCVLIALAYFFYLIKFRINIEPRRGENK